MGCVALDRVLALSGLTIGGRSGWQLSERIRGAPAPAQRGRDCWGWGGVSGWTLSPHSVCPEYLLFYLFLM